jgi:hypothetical protein
MRLALALLLSLSCSFAVGRGLSDGDVIDSVFIHAQTGQPALVLSVDEPVDSGAAEKKLDYKLGTYIGFARSGDLYARYPKANRAERPLIIFVFEFQPSSRVRSMIFGARERLIEMGFDVQLKVYDEAARKNVDLAP